MSNLPATIEDALTDRKMVSRFTAGRYDTHMKVAAERQFALQIISRNEQLQRCTPESIQTALLDASYSGLSLSPSLAHAYLIPYENQCTFAPGYRGLMHLAYRAGTVKSVQPNLVYDRDREFVVWTDENGRHLRHIETRGARGEVSHAYCIANLAAGGPPIIEVMNRSQLRAIEKAATSRVKGGMVWRGPFREEMCKKAVIRRASKFWPKDDGGVLEHMMEVSDRHDGIDFEATEADTDQLEQELCLSADQITALDTVLIDNGVPGTLSGEWLRRYALQLSYGSIEDVPARLYEKAKRELTEYAKKWASEK